MNFQSKTLLLCTANTFNYRGYNPKLARGEMHKPIHQALTDLQTQLSPDISVFAFQEVHSDDVKQIQTAFSESIVAQDGDYSGNGMAANNGGGPLAKTRILDLPSDFTFGQKRTRKAIEVSLATIDGEIKVVSTHLTGGKYDDQEWYELISKREEQLAYILDQCDRPNAIIGDFNAPSSLGEPLTEYWTNLLQMATEAGANVTAQDVVKYNCGVHSFLLSEGYRSVFDSATHNGSTTPFGTVSDYIYIRDDWRLGNCNVLSQGKIPAIRLHISDHDFLWVLLEVRAS